MQMFHTGGQQQELDVLEPGEGEGVDDLDGVVVDHLVILVIQCENIWHLMISLITSMEMCSEPAKA